MESTFALGAGFSAAELNVLIRTMIAALIVLWGAWIMHKQFQSVGEGRMSIGMWGANVVKMVLLIVFVLIIVGV